MRRDPEHEMTFFEHLDELRTRLIISIAATSVCSIAGWYLSPWTLETLLKLCALKSVQYFGPADAFMVRMKIAILIGIVIAAPVIILEIWLFVAPGLYKHERRFAFPTIVSAVILFFIGAAFGVWALPMTLKVLQNFGGTALEARYSIDRFISFTGVFVLGFALVFEVPVLLVLLAKIGIIDHKMLSSNRKLIIIIVLVVGAILSPPDIASQMIMSAPLYLLFEVSVFIIRFIKKPSRQDEET